MKEFFKPTKFKRSAFFIVGDILISIFSAILAFFLRFNGDVPNEFYKGLLLYVFTITILRVFFLWISKIYLVPWRFFGLYEARKIFAAHILAMAIFIVIYAFFDDVFSPFARSVIIIDAAICYILISGFRISKRMLTEPKNNNSEACIVVGATQKALHVLKGMKEGYINYYAVGVFDIRKEAIGTTCENFIVKNQDDIPKFIKKYNAKTAIIALKLNQDELKKLHDELTEYGIENVKIFSLIEGGEIRSVTVEDLLARKPKDLNSGVVREFIKDKVVLVTGAGGTIGSEICKQCLKFGVKRLIMVDHSEFNLYQINENTNQDPRNSLKMVNIVYKDELDKIFKEFSPEIVVHAAAYKHVPLCEFNPKMAVVNNILGTKNIIDTSIKYGVRKVVLISTDKAVRPTNIMGATKRVCELYALNSTSQNSEISAVRFGNVLESSGSVIPKFRALIEQNRNLTVTHPDIVRYFMLVNEACQLVLQAASIAKGGELFVLDMGKQVKIADLAKKMINLAGKEKELKVEYVGLRAGEKLYEELLIDESDKKTEFESIFVTTSAHYDLELLNSQILALLECKNEDEIEARLKEIVPEFKHALNKKDGDENFTSD
ncbi:MAG: polysaccharide biosynthesis protein [Campylobacter sp.]|nr:polysaccharide biosynthesis protein [Campylobacter sp.]